MNEIKTDLFPDSLRASRNGRSAQDKETGKVSQSASMKAESGYAGAVKAESGYAGTMKAESGYADTMSPEEPLPESDRSDKDKGDMA